MNILKDWKVLLSLFVLAALFTTLHSVSTSPLYHGLYIDSQIFQYMGFAISQGKIPYVDLFDHKGLLLYLINALGYIINKNVGVLFLQILSLTITLTMWYRIFVTLVREKWLKWTLIILSLHCLYPFYWYGNFTQEWALPFISYPYMIYVENLNRGIKYFENKNLLLIGLCIGCLFSLQINSAAPLLGLLLYCLSDAIVHREYVYIGRAFTLITMGILLPIILSFVYMYVVAGKEGVDAYVYANLFFNLEYSESGFLWQHLSGRFSDIFKTLLPVLLIIPLIRKYSDVIIPILLGTIFSFFSLGVRPFFHYQAIFIPLIVLSLSYLTLIRYRYVAFAILALYYGKTLYVQFDTEHYPIGKDSYLEAFDNMISPIPEYERDSIWNMEGTFLINEFRKKKIVQMNRMFLPMQIGQHQSLYETEGGKIKEVSPLYVVMVNYKEDWMIGTVSYNRKGGTESSEFDRKYVLENYDKVSSAYWPDGTEIMCFRRKK